MSGMSLIQQRAQLANAEVVQNANASRQPDQAQPQSQRRNNASRGNPAQQQAGQQQQQQNQPQSQQQPHPKQQRQPRPKHTTKPQQYNTNVTSRVRHNSTDTSDTCLLCAYSLAERQHIGVYNCTHSGQICADCLIRTKLLMPPAVDKSAPAKPAGAAEWQWKCPFCRTDWSTVIVTSTYEHRLLPIDRFDKTALVKDEHACVQYEDQQTAQHFVKQYSVYCPICENQNVQSSFNTNRQYEQHLQHQHKLYLCSACVATRRVYIAEQQPYTRTQLLQHFKLGATFERARTGPIEPHPFCEFCSLPFYSNDELYAHLTQVHRTCRFCQADNKQIYCRNDAALIKHYSRHHYICDHPDCMQKIGNISPDSIAFRDPIALRTHTINFHTDKSNMSKAELKQLQTMDVTMFRSQQAAHGGHDNRQRNRRFSHDNDTFEWTALQTANSNARSAQLVVDDADAISDASLDSDEESYPSLNNVQQAQRDTAAAQQNEQTGQPARPAPNGFAAMAAHRVQPRSDVEFPALQPARPASSAAASAKAQQQQQPRTAAQSLFGYHASLQHTPSVVSTANRSMYAPPADSGEAFPSLSSLAAAVPAPQPVKKSNRPTLVTSFKSTVDASKTAQAEHDAKQQAKQDKRKLMHVPLPMPEQVSATEIQARSQALINNVKQALHDDDKFNEFRQTSNMFRQGNITAASYYAYFCEVFGSNSEALLMEVIALLPDADKRDAIHTEYARNKVWSTIKPKQNAAPKLTAAQVARGKAKVSIVRSTVGGNSDGEGGDHVRQFDSQINGELVPLRRDSEFDSISPEPVQTSHQQLKPTTAPARATTPTPSVTQPSSQPARSNALSSRPQSSQSTQNDIRIPTELPDASDLDIYLTAVSELQLPARYKSDLQLLLLLLSECINVLVRRHQQIGVQYNKRFMLSAETRRLLYKYASTVKYSNVHEYSKLCRFGLQPGSCQSLNGVASMFQRYGSDMIDGGAVFEVMQACTSTELLLMYEYVNVALQHLTDVEHNGELRALQQQQAASQRTIPGKASEESKLMPLQSKKGKQTSVFDR